MKNILIIDDDLYQFNYIKDALFKEKNTMGKTFFPVDDYQCFPSSDTASNFCSKIRDFANESMNIELYFFIFKYIEKNEISAIFTDRSFKSNQLTVSGNADGEILINMLIKNKLHEEIPIVIYSRKEEESALLEKLYGNILDYVTIGVSEDSTSYMNRFYQDIGSLNQVNGNYVNNIFLARIKSFEDREFKYNLAIVCALKKEYDEVVKFLENQIVLRHDVGCKKRELKCGYMIDRDEGIIIKVLLEYLKDEDFYGSYGYTAMKDRVKDIIEDCKPEYITTTGVMAGYYDKKKYIETNTRIYLGNIIIPKRVFIPDGEKEQREPIEWGEGFKPYIDTLYKSYHTEKKILDIATEKYLNEVEEKDEISKLINKIDKQNRQQMYVEVKIATVLNKVEDQGKFDKIVEQQEDTKGLEMEIYGLYEVPNSSKIKAIAFKSVVDYGNQDVDKTWQNFGSYLSAYVMHTFFMKIIYPEKLKESK